MIKPTRTARPPLRARRDAGFTMVAAVFLITLLVLLSAYLINFRVYQDAGVALDVLGTRAHAAARAGIEWGAYNALRNGNCAASTALALGGTLAGYTVTVTCTSSAYDEAGATVNVNTLVATACNNAICPQATPGPNYVERQVTAMVVSP